MTESLEVVACGCKEHPTKRATIWKPSEKKKKSCRKVKNEKKVSEAVQYSYENENVKEIIKNQPNEQNMKILPFLKTVKA